MSPGSSSKLRWLWRAPARALGRARDFYVRSVTGCARYVPSDAAFGAYPVLVPVPAPLPRSYSCGSDWGEDDDLRELIRAASQRQQEQQRAQAVPVGVVRSQSMAGRLPSSMARIDEDAPCEFGGGGSGEGLYSRSRSYVGGGAEGIRRSRFHGKVGTFG